MHIIDLITYVVTALIGLLSPIWIIICAVLFVKASGESDSIKKNKTKKWAIISIVLPLSLIALAILIRIMTHVVVNI